MREYVGKENKKGELVINQENTTKSMLDYKGEPYTSKINKIEIKTVDGKDIVFLEEGNILGLKGAVELKVNISLYLYKNFFALGVHEEEWDRIMGLLEDEKYITKFYTYKGLHIENWERVWSQNPEAIEAMNNRAYLYNRSWEEVEKRKNAGASDQNAHEEENENV